MDALSKALSNGAVAMVGPQFTSVATIIEHARTNKIKYGHINKTLPHKPNSTHMSLIKVAYAIQPLAAASKVPLLGYGPYSAGLSNLPFFLRTTQSNKDQMLMMVSHRLT